MYIILSHSGSQDHNEFIEKAKEELESNIGVTCETSITFPNNEITVYNEDLEEIIKFSKIPELEEIEWHVRNYLNLEEN